ncbi:MAG: glutathione-disulfide reductase [Betaproteobacteria bacterium]
MATYDFDLYIIGGGSGGVRAGRFASGFGARVALAEDRLLGGTCVNLGCIPKKLFSYAAHYHEDFEDAAGYGWNATSTTFDWPTLLANKDRVIARLNGIYERILTGANVEIHRDRAVLSDPHAIEVGGRRVTAKHILVATGGTPVRPIVPGAGHAITSDEAFHLPRLPRRAIVVGGGYIAVEFASIFQGLGVATTLAYRGERLLKDFDGDIGPFLAEQMKAKGLDIQFLTQIAHIDRNADGTLAVRMAHGSVQETDAVLYATGRLPHTSALGLEEAGVALQVNGAIPVDEHFQTRVPSIHAIGDCIDRVQLTPVALAEGMAVADRLFNTGTRELSYDGVPTAVFSHPNVGVVGLSEEAARAAGHDLTIYRTTFTALRHTLTGRNERVLMKLVVDKPSDRVLGVHMVGPDAGEVIQGFAVALKCGATKRQFDSTLGIHPTIAEEFVTLREPVG